MRTWLCAALAVVAATSGTASAAPQPAPVYWQGDYGNAPFYARQVVIDAPNNYCAAPKDLLSSLLSLVSNGWYCPAASVSPANRPGGDFLAEYAVCVSDDATAEHREEFTNYENEFEIYDDDAGAVVRHWTEPSTYAAHNFVMQGGDCAFWLWNLPMVTDAGTPLTSGHTHHLLFHHGGGIELVSQYFVAP